MFFGDAAEGALANFETNTADVLKAEKVDILKTDVVKVTHHGFKLNKKGRDIEERLYPKMSPTISIISNAAHKILKEDGSYKKKRLILC